MKCSRVLVLCCCLVLLAAPLPAEEQGSIVMTETVMSLAPPLPVEPLTVPPPPLPEPVVTVPAPTTEARPAAASAPPVRLPSRRMMLDFFQIECMPLVKVERGGMSSFFSSENPLVGKCLEDLSHFADVYREQPDSAEALAIAAELFRLRKDYAHEALCLARIRYLYGESAGSTGAAERLKKLANGELQDEAKALAVLAEGSAATDPQLRHQQLVRDLAALTGKGFSPLVREECDRYLERFADGAGAEAILALREELYQREKRYEPFAAGLRRLVRLYPDSPERPQRLVTLAEVLTTQLEQHSAALTTFEEVFTAYPTAPEALRAYERSATITAEELKRYPQAVELLKRIVELYPRADAARAALKYQAALQVKSKDYQGAIAAWLQLDDMFPASDDGVAALVSAAGLARTYLEDYGQQIAIQQRLIDEYAKRDEALQARLERAQTLEEKLGRRAEALAGYEELANGYAGHPVADKARSRLERLRKKS